MSRKKLLITENNLFTANINTLVGIIGGKTAFASALKVSYDTVRSWCMGEFLPGGSQLLSIHKKFGVSIDWLLTGIDPSQMHSQNIKEASAIYSPSVDSLDGWPEEIKDACRQVRNILLSDHSMIKDALLSNLLAFQRLHSLEEKNKAKKITDIEEAVSSSIGKPET